MSGKDGRRINAAAVAALLGGNLEGFLVASTPGGIEAQEQAGQRSFVASETLPRECPRAQLEQLGFIFGEDADDLFVRVQFPTGWSKRATEHSMWSDLLDEHGRKRGAIFYKAAFYDRTANMHLVPRYICQVRPEGGWEMDRQTARWEAVVLDCEQVLCVVDSADLPGLDSDDAASRRAAYGRKDALQARALAWLDEHCPAWRDPLAYWD